MKYDRKYVDVIYDRYHDIYQWRIQNFSLVGFLHKTCSLQHIFNIAANS